MRRYVFEKRWKRVLAAMLDVAGGTLFFRRKARPVPALQRVLVVRLDHLGDVILALPVLEALARLQPKPFVATLTSAAAAVLLRDMPAVDERLVFEAAWFARAPGAGDSPWRLLQTLRARRFDAALELRGDARHIVLLSAAGIPFLAGPGNTGGAFLLHREVKSGERHVLEQNLLTAAAVGASLAAAPRPHLIWQPRADETAWLANLDLGAKLLLFHPEAGAAAKKWPEERFAALAAVAVQRGWTPVVIGTGRAADASWPGGTRDLRGKTGLPQLVTLIQAAGGLVSNDSGPAHIAAALQKPTLLPWSWANDPALWAPRGAGVRWVEVRTPCAPCRRSVCAVPGHPCLTDITVDRMGPLLHELLDAAVP